MAMAMASDYWEVVGDAFCDVRVDVTELAKQESPFTTSKFRMLFESTIRRVTSDEAEGDRLLDDDVIPRVITKRAYIEFDAWNSSYMDEAISETLRQQLLVPMEERSSMVHKVMFKACEAAQRLLGPYAGGKVVCMEVDIDFYVIDDEVDEDGDGGFGLDYYEPRFVPASTMSIEKLEKTRVQVPSTVCSICMDEMMVGFEATTLPCGHLYHEACIVGWLQQSGVCPLCKFRMPKQQDHCELANVGSYSHDMIE